MKSWKLALTALLAAGTSAVLSTPARAQFDPSGGGAFNQTAESRKAVTAAQADVNKVKQSMKRIEQKIETRFMEEKEDWAAAKEKHDKAKAAVAAAEKPIKSRLAVDKQYKALKEKQFKAQERREALQDKGTKADPAELDKAQQEVLEAGLAIRKMEKEAVDNDPALVEAKQLLEEAQNEMEAMKDELKDVVENDVDYQTAQTELATAEDALEQAKMSLQQQQISARQQAQQQRDSQRQQRSSGRPGRSGRSGGAGGYPGGYGGR